MYEPIYGSAPDIAGKEIAHPLATILSVAMMFQYSFKLDKESQMIQTAVNRILDNGLRTKDIITQSNTLISTVQMGDQVITKLNKMIKSASTLF